MTDAEQKWKNVTTEDSPVIVYKDDGKLIGETTYIKIPLSLIEQIQSEAERKGVEAYKNLTHPLIESLIKRKEEEARADERKKWIEELKMLKDRLNSICEDIPTDRLSDAGDIVNTMLFLIKESEQPEEEKKRYCAFCEKETVLQKDFKCYECKRDNFQ